MAKDNYSDKLKDPRWQRKRLEILNRDEFTCRYCADTSTTLHIHHLAYSKEPWETDNKKLITLCEHCHLLAEFLKKNGDVGVSSVYKIINAEENYVFLVGKTAEASMAFYVYHTDKRKVEYHFTFLSGTFKKIIQFFNPAQ